MEFPRKLGAIRELDVKVVLAAHLPPAVGMIDRLLEILKDVPNAEPFVAPNQSVLTQMRGQA